MTNANFGSYNRQKFAISAWVKPTTGADMILINRGDGSTAAGSEFNIQITAGRTVSFVVWIGSGSARITTTSAVITSATWNHIYVTFDSTNATAGDRMRMWINGTEITSFSVDTNPTLNDSANSTSVATEIGRIAGSQYFNGLVFQLMMISGEIPAITAFYSDTFTQKPIMITTMSGQKFYLDGATIVSDAVLTADWTNTNSVASSTDIPKMAGNWVGA